MNTYSPPHPALVPTLTEVIDIHDIGTTAPVPAPSPSPMSAQAAPDSTPGLEGQVTQRVLSDVQRQIDSMLEFRLREAMAPVLARHSEAIVRDLKEELAQTMRDVVARSVAQEIAKLRQR
jgi:hypothetical protein